jgi:hypothetical protein
MMKHSFLKTSRTHTNMAVDIDSGEILEQDVMTVKYLANSREQFFLMYASLLGVFQEMSGPEIKVYSYILEHYISNSAIPLPKGMKQIIGDSLKLSLGTVNNAISTLAAKKLIFPSQRGIYKINPRYAFKGSTKDRNAMLKVILELECPDC